MPSITLNTISTQDLAFGQVWALREEVLRRPLGLSLHNEDLSGEASEIIVTASDDAGNVTGCVMMRRIDDSEVKLRQMAVSTEHQGQGIGSAILRKAEEVAAAAGYKIITLHARDVAVPFYKAAGYQVKGDVFTEVGIPHLYMYKAI